MFVVFFLGEVGIDPARDASFVFEGAGEGGGRGERKGVYLRLSFD